MSPVNARLYNFYIVHVWSLKSAEEKYITLS